MSQILPFMIRNGEQKHITEDYVSIPPALVITDEAGNIWTLGFSMGHITGGEYTFNVLCNGVDTGKYASRIERIKGQIRIFNAGWEVMKVVKQEPIRIYAIGAKMNKATLITRPVRVKVYFDSRPDIPVLSFSFHPFVGYMENLEHTPISCAPGTWLYAIVDSDDVMVAGYLGDKNIREIPVLKGEKV